MTLKAAEVVVAYFGVSTELSGNFQFFFLQEISNTFLPALHILTDNNICSRGILGINGWFKKNEKHSGKDNSPDHSYFSIAKLRCPVWRDDPAGETDFIWHETEEQAPARWAPWDALSWPHLVPAGSSKCFMDRTDELRGPFGMIETLRSWFGVPCNLRVLFSFSSLVFDCLNIFILSKMKGTAVYSLKGENQGTEKLSASNNIVKTQKWSTRINLLSSSRCPACRSTSVHLQERHELSASSRRTWANHSFQSWHLLPLLAHLKDALSTHTLEKSFMCTIIGKKAEISEKKRCAEKWIMILCSFDLLTGGSYVCMVI